MPQLHPWDHYAEAKKKEILKISWFCKSCYNFIYFVRDAICHLSKFAIISLNFDIYWVDPLHCT